MRGADQCPKCSGTDTMTARHPGMDYDVAGCVPCGILWEPFDLADLVDWDHHDEFRPFAKGIIKVG